MKGITNKERKAFFSNFNEKLLLKIQELKSSDKIMRHYRTPETLEKDFVKKCNDSGMSKTEVINASIAKFTYCNTLTARGAVMIISKKNSVVGKAAELALTEEDGIKTFCDHIKEQCEQGNEKSLKKNHGKDVINAILNHK